ncbi:glycosyltransferase [Escherichia coli]
MNRKVLIIMVTYNPDWSKVISKVKSFCVAGTVFVSDNSDSDSSSLINYENVIYRYNHGNVGIAKAQNLGIEYAMQYNYEFVAFVDDDSNLSGGKITQLTNNLCKLGSLGENIAAFCAYPSERGGFDKTKKTSLGRQLLLTKNLMSSGSLTKVDVFKKIGLFDEDLFIDYVDYEWGWRALEKNFLIVIDTSVEFEHSLGQGRSKIGLGIPSPIRHFYQTRNLLWISRLNYVPIYWKLKQFLLLPIRYFYFGFFYNHSKLRRTHFLKGFAAGLKFKS